MLSTQSQPGLETSNAENLYMIKNECAQIAKGEVEKNELDMKLKKEFSDLDWSGLNELGKVM